MKKVMIGILAGNGPKSKLYDLDFPTFQNSDEQDMFAFYPVKIHPNWTIDPKIGTLVDDGGKVPGKGVVPLIRNRMIDFAIEKGYEVLWCCDDDIRNFYKYKTPVTDVKKPLEYTRKTPLPTVEHEYGAIIGANFKRHKLITGKKYSNQVPFSCIYLNLKLLKEKLGHYPHFDEDPMLWDDFDFCLQMRKEGIVPMTFNEYACVKNGSQDSETTGKSLAAAGADHATRLGYGTYKKWGHANTYIKLKTNIIDVSPAMTKKFIPDGFMKYKYPVDTYENWRAAVLADADNIRKSEKAKKEGIGGLTD